MAAPIFWRDAALPHVEVRKVDDGRTVCYAPHSHREWSMGAITGGQSIFLCGERAYRVAEGDLVLINPDEVHECNPIDGEPWSYLMLYVDAAWLAGQRHALGLTPTPQWRVLKPDTLGHAEVFAAFVSLVESLLGDALGSDAKGAALQGFLAWLLPLLAEAEDAACVPAALGEVAGYLDADCTRAHPLSQLSRRARVCPEHLVRSFKRHFGLTPHAYLLNRRVQYAQRALRQGQAIAEAALASGFADQAHFQRVFKRLLASTPRQYQRASRE